MSLLEQLKINPSNPRNISNTDFEKLKQSIKDFPKMMELRPIVYDDDFMVLGGNMRLKALLDLNGQIEIKDEWFKKASDLTEEQKKEFVIKDNIPAGKWDFDILANEWGDLPLDKWGLNVTGWIDNKDDNQPKEIEAWKGMPEFTEKPSFNAYKTLYVHFETEEDYKNFAEFIGQKLTEKTQYIWYPEKEKQNLQSMEFKSTDEV